VIRHWFFSRKEISMSSPKLEGIAFKISRYLGLSDPKFVAKGAFKETFLVVNPAGQLQALKVIDVSKQNLKRTEREIEALKRCDCPGICRIFAHGTWRDDSGTVHEYSLEEFLGGGTLTDRLKGGRLSTGQVRSYGRDLAIAIDHLKNLALVHRDIKPDNIMFREGDERPVLVDLGLVRDLSMSSLTQSWMMRGPGTPYFASPEQLNNEKRLISWKSDQFSLGVVLSICLLGRHPYDTGGLQPGEIVAAVAERKGIPTSFEADAAQNGLPGLARMVEAWPIRRYQRTEEMIGVFAASQ
jgi:serine/threonine protein kinase